MPEPPSELRPPEPHLIRGTKPPTTGDKKAIMEVIELDTEATISDPVAKEEPAGEPAPTSVLTGV